MNYTFRELKHLTVEQLREIAAGIEHEAVQGHTQMNKEHLVKAICTALHIDTFEHHQVKGLDKTQVKSRIKLLKKDREQALASRDHKKLKEARNRIRRMKRKLRRAMV